MASLPPLALCDCDSMRGRFGAHREQCPWQIAFIAQLETEEAAANKNTDLIDWCMHPEWTAMTDLRVLPEVEVDTNDATTGEK